MQLDVPWSTVKIPSGSQTKLGRSRWRLQFSGWVRGFGYIPIDHGSLPITTVIVATMKHATSHSILITAKIIKLIKVKFNS